MSWLATASLVVAQVLTNTAMKKRALTTTSTIEYTVLPLEVGLATSALIVKARKFEKKISRQPCVGIYHVISFHAMLGGRRWVEGFQLAVGVLSRTSGARPW